MDDLLLLNLTDADRHALFAALHSAGKGTGPSAHAAEEGVPAMRDWLEQVRSFVFDCAD